MSSQQEQLKKLQKFAELDSTSARLLYIYNEYSGLEDRVNQVVSLFKGQLEENSKLREEQIKDLAKRIVVKGDKGDKGERGEKGEKGEKGKDGQDAEVTEEVINSVAFSIESQLPPMIDTHVSDALASLRLPASKIDNLEENIDITKLNTADLRLDASQISNLPKGSSAVNYGGSTGLERILSSGTLARSGATEIDFGNNLTVTRTSNGVRVDATGGGGGGTDDQTAAEVPFTPAGNIAATDVQAALEELDSEKAATSHTHTLSAITDSGSLAALDDLSTFDTDDLSEGATNKYNVTHTGDAIGATSLSVVALRGVGLDSTVGSPSDGNILVYRSAGSDWVLEAKPAGGSNPAINDITDVTISSVADNEVLAYDNGTNEWINQTPAEAGLATSAQGALADSAVQPGDNVSDLTNDAGYITDTLSNEQVQDIAGAMFTGNTETLITATYQDADGTIDLVVDNDLSNYDNSTSSFATTAQLHDAVTVSDTSEIDLTLTGQEISAAIVAGSIDETKLDTSVNASLDLADSALQSSDIGSSVQAYDADLDTWAGLTPSANAQSLVTAANYAAMRALLDLEAGTDFYSISATDSAIDADIATHAALTATHGVSGDIVGTSDTQTLTGKTIDGDNNTISNLDIGNEVDWAAATDVTDASAFESGDKVLIFEAGVGMRKVDYDDLPSGGGIGGSTGATDNAILRADGTGGSTIQSSGVTIDDADNLSVDGSINLGGSLNTSGGNTAIDISSMANNDYLSLDDDAGVLSLSAAGTSTNLDLDLNAKGTGTVTIGGSDVIYLSRSSVSGASWLAGTVTSATDKAVTPSAVQTYVSGLIGSTIQAYDADLDTYAANPLTSGEIGQLQNINSVTISNTQWGYLGALNQGLTTTSDVTFADIAYTTSTGSVSALGNLGATEAIDWSTATHFTGTLDSNVTITHSNEVSGQKITLVLSYSGAQRTITWSDVDLWAGGTEPTAPDTGETLIVTLLYVGTTCYGSYELFS